MNLLLLTEDDIFKIGVLAIPNDFMPYHCQPEVNIFNQTPYELIFQVGNGFDHEGDNIPPKDYDYDPNDSYIVEITSRLQVSMSLNGDEDELPADMANIYRYLFKLEEQYKEV